MAVSQERITAEYETLFQLTGEFIREWVEFEQYLMWPTSALLGTDEWRARMILASHRSFRGKSDLLLQLSATFASEEANRRMVAMLKTARSIADKRNIVAHQWGGIDGPSRAVFMSDRADTKLGTDFAGYTNFDLANFKQWLDTIQQLKRECIAIFKGCCSVVYVEAKMHRKEQPVQTG